MTETRRKRDVLEDRVLASELVGPHNKTRSLPLVICAVSLLTLAAGQSQSLPPGVIKALSDDEAQCCKAVAGKFEESCHRRFVANLRWRELQITPAGTIAILVENQNTGFCGSAGCALGLFLQGPDGTYVEALDEVGNLEGVKVLKTVSKGHYDLQKTWTHRQGKTIYRWDGSLYLETK